MVANDRRAGFTIAEVLVAFVLLAMAATAVAGAATAAADGVRRHHRAEAAIHTAAWLVDSLAAGGANGAGSIRLDDGRMEWTTDAGWVHARILSHRGRVVGVLSGASETRLPISPMIP